MSAIATITRGGLERKPFHIGRRIEQKITRIVGIRDNRRLGQIHIIPRLGRFIPYSIVIDIHDLNSHVIGGIIKIKAIPRKDSRQTTDFSIFVMLLGRHVYIKDLARMTRNSNIFDKLIVPHLLGRLAQIISSYRRDIDRLYFFGRSGQVDSGVPRDTRQVKRRNGQFFFGLWNGVGALCKRTVQKFIGIFIAI